MRYEYNIKAEVLQTENVAVCELVVGGDEILEFVVDAKRYVDDEADLRTGREVALGKALLQAAAYLLEGHV